MRTISTSMDALLNAPFQQRSVFVKVIVYSREVTYTPALGGGLITRITSRPVEITNLYGRNWVKSVEYGTSIDAVASDAVVTVGRNVEDQTLVPFLSARFPQQGVQVCRPGNLLYIYTATMPLDILPEESDYILVFNGAIDDVTIEESITFRARDSTVTTDSFITSERHYGSYDYSISVEHVMRAILAQWAIGARLYTPNGTAGMPISPMDYSGWYPKQSLQQRQPVMDALKAYADQIGYDLRYRWHKNTNQFQLVLSNPNRVVATPLRIFSPDQFRTVSIDYSRINLRNIVAVSYESASGQRGITPPARDQISVDQYGPRYMEVAEESGSQIDTLTEAKRMRDAILKDTKAAELNYNIDMPYFYAIELSDYYGIEPGSNEVYFNETQMASVQSYRHKITNDGVAVTSMALSGKEKSGNKKWPGKQAEFSYRKVGTRNTQTSASNRNIVKNGDLTQWSGF